MKKLFTCVLTLMLLCCFSYASMAADKVSGDAAAVLKAAASIKEGGTQKNPPKSGTPKIIKERINESKTLQTLRAERKTLNEKVNGYPAKIRVLRSEQRDSLKKLEQNAAKIQAEKNKIGASVRAEMKAKKKKPAPKMVPITSAPAKT